VEPGAGNPHAGFDVAGTGNRVDDRLEGVTLDPKGEKRLGLTWSVLPLRQSSTLLVMAKAGWLSYPTNLVVHLAR
jgi:hypothetical protein